VFATTLAELGETETEIGSGGAIVIVAGADLVASATEVAVSFTVALVGTAAGGVYVVTAPLAVLVGATMPQLGEHGAPPCVMDHVTPALLASF
jgi:hypothetical protein